jgi:glycosyltransferase involved in cell wall biosynthesis
VLNLNRANRRGYPSIVDSFKDGTCAPNAFGSDTDSQALRGRGSPDGKTLFAQPLVSIVTASFNMASYLRETIESVRAQAYQNVEHIVIDAGSTDGTLAILKEYAGKLSYTSQPDRGAADAIRKGFASSRGSILAFLNADDTYLPGAIARAVQALAEHPEVAMVYGDAYWVDSRGEVISPYPSKPFDRARLAQECFICQPTAFFRREAYYAIGGIDPSLHYAFDYDLWIRLSKDFQILKLDHYLATSRMHAANKTLSEPRRANEEAVGLLDQHYGFIPPQWIIESLKRRFSSTLCFTGKGRRPVFSYGLALPLGLMLNRRHPVRYLREWNDLLVFQSFKRWCRSGLTRSPRRARPTTKWSTGLRKLLPSSKGRSQQPYDQERMLSASDAD